MTEVLETVWPDESFAQFGGHVLERLARTKEGMKALRHKRFRVRVTIEMDPYAPAVAPISQNDPYVTLKECLHVDDIMAADIPDSSATATGQ